MRESPDDLTNLRHRLARIEGRRSDAVARFTIGHAPVDALLGGGLVRGRLHEIRSSDTGTASAATAFAALLAWQASDRRRAMVWLRTEHAEREAGPIYGPGIAGLGLDPGGLVLGVVPDDVALLRAAADAARCAGLGAVVVECWRDPRVLDLTASRRLTLAAEASGVTILLLRIDAGPSITAAETRWGVRALPSVALAAAPGHPLFEIEMLRRRAGPSGQSWRLEWNRDAQSFRDPARDLGQSPTLPRAVVRLPAGGSLAAAVAEPRRRAG